MKTVATHKTYGLVIGLILAVLSFGLYALNAQKTPGMQYLSYIPFLGGLVLNAIAFSKANDHQVTFGDVFASGFKASAIIALVITATTLLMLVAFPNMKDEAINMARIEMENQGKASEDIIEQSLEFTSKYFYVLMISGAVFGTILQGVVFSLIGAAIAKKKGRPNPMMNA